MGTASSSNRCERVSHLLGPLLRSAGIRQAVATFFCSENNTGSRIRREDSSSLTAVSMVNEPQEPSGKRIVSVFFGMVKYLYSISIKCRLKSSRVTVAWIEDLPRKSRPTARA